MTEKNGVERSTATDVLRRMLDERGVEHYDGTETTLWLKDGIGYRASADEGLNGYIHLHLWCTTPEQAIAATLSAGTCHITRQFTCSECGHQYPTRNYEYYVTCDGRSAYAPLGYYVLDCKKPNYCPNCGRRIEQ